MKTLRILHTTDYHYRSPVTFGTHRAMIRPREGHDLHIKGARLSIQPDGTVRWIRDIYDNSIAILTFAKASDHLSLQSEVTVEIYDDNPLECLVDPAAKSFPFEYSADEQLEIIPYRLAGHPGDAPAVLGWLAERIYRPGDLANTFDLLKNLNSAIHQDFIYAWRDEPGVQSPARTLELGSGSCRDYAFFFMEAARHLGLAARFVTGYILLGEGNHGATHAWVEVYIPGTGWRGFDPTNNKLAGFEHVSVAVARDPHKASPLSGTWSGPADAFEKLNVSVQVVAV
ncbi:MAG: transglutaminase family protein [Terrimicrobiaceae bacterium]|nr:transglutaminase family protein [Terrimicrobiaceae bacterium]